MNDQSISKSSQFDQYFDEGGDITSFIVPSSVKRPGLEQRRVNIDFPIWVIKSLDLEATRVGVSRQSLIKMWITEKLENKVHAS
jgi:hypothetical protein